MNIGEIVDEQKLFYILKKTKSSLSVSKILDKALVKKGLDLEEVGYLINNSSSKELFEAAGKIKREIYGERIVLFAPLYISSFCINNCKYCGFQKSNSSLRKKLSLKEIEEEVIILEKMGHKRILLECGEHPDENPIDFVVSAIKTIYGTKWGKGEIRRVNVNIAATSKENYKKLKEAGIGTYQLFQETYHRASYEKFHEGPKENYERQLFAHDRAFEAGIDDVGLGVLFGLYDWRFDLLALISHAKYLDKKYGVGPHTFSVPRWQPAEGANWKAAPYPVSEEELLKIIAILRLAVPYTGMIISTRERPEIREKAFEIGISQTSAASITAPGGYHAHQKLSQFSLQDHRSLDQVLLCMLKKDLLPSFCTACYRLNRTGKAFMDLAKPGSIQNLCRPNALLTFKEYLEDYASEEVKKLGIKIIDKYLTEIPNKTIREETKKRLSHIEKGARDLYF